MILTFALEFQEICASFIHKRISEASHDRILFLCRFSKNFSALWYPHHYDERPIKFNDSSSRK